MTDNLQPVTTAIEFFSQAELECKGSRKIEGGTGKPGTGIIKLDPRFAAALPELRRAWGKSLNPNSICRTPEHNAKVGGNPNSLHMTENAKWPTIGTMAADISWRGWPVEEQLAFARVAWGMGWAIGLHNGFCHVDRRADLGLPNLPQSVFLYGEWANNFNRDDIVA
jgi:hypothetical protein